MNAQPHHQNVMLLVKDVQTMKDRIAVAASVLENNLMRMNQLALVSIKYLITQLR
jgi:hypothetical protein